MARKATRRARMERAITIGVTIRTRPAGPRLEVMRLAAALSTEHLALAVRLVRAFLAA